VKLPNQGNIVLYGIFVGADESHLFGDGGCDKQTVKRVAVNQRKRFKDGKVGSFYRKDGKTIGLCKMNKTGDLTGKIQFPQTDFYCKFPRGDYTQMYLVGKLKDYFSGCFGKGFVAVKIPNRRMCVQQVTAHLHIVLKVLKRFVKIISHDKFTLCTAESASFSAFRESFGSKGKNNRSRRYFARYVNGQPVAGGYLYGLGNAHKENIA